MTIPKDSPEHSYNQFISIIRQYPMVWFDTATMALMIHKSKRTVARYRKIVKERNWIEERSKCFKYKQTRT